MGNRLSSKGEHKEFHKITMLITLNKNGWGSKSNINSKSKRKDHVIKTNSTWGLFYQTRINLNLVLDRTTIAAKITKAYTWLVEASIKILATKPNRNKPYKINMNHAS